MFSKESISLFQVVSQVFSPLHHSATNIERALGESLLQPEQQCFLIVCLIHDPKVEVNPDLAERMYFARDEEGFEEHGYEIDSVVISAASKDEAMLKLKYYKPLFAIESVSATPFHVKVVKQSDVPNVEPVDFRYLSQDEWDNCFRDKGWMLSDGGYVRNEIDAKKGGRIFSKSGVLPAFRDIAFTPKQIEHLMQSAV